MASKKEKIFRVILFVGTAVSLWFVPWVLVWAWILPLPNSIQEQADEALTHGLDGIIVYIDEAGKPPEFYAAGWKNRADKLPADPHSLFKIASIGKLYTAVAIAKLANAGHLSLDQTLVEFFPELEGKIENADKITLKMMVQHRSGIPNYTNSPNFWVNPPESEQQALGLIFDLPASFEPNEGYEYSNTNYLLLGRIIDLAVGYGHQKYIKGEILMPLGLKNTYGSLSEVNIDEVMGGYYVGIERDLKTDNNGSMLATAEDVGIFLRALNDGSLFKEKEQEIYSSIYVYEHTGLIPGYQSFAKYHEDIDTVVIVFVNTTNFSGYTWNIAEILYNRIVKIIEQRRK